MEGLEALGKNKKNAVYYTAPLLAAYQDRITHDSVTTIGLQTWALSSGFARLRQPVSHGLVSIMPGHIFH